MFSDLISAHNSIHFSHVSIIVSVLWLCLHLGTRLRFHRGPNVEWQEADELRDSDDDSDDEMMQSSSLKVAFVNSV